MTRKEAAKYIKELTKESILDAISIIDTNGINEGERSQYYDLSYQNKLYPPKLVVSLAGESKNGIKIDRNVFGGGMNTLSFKTLVKHGFEIVKKDGGIAFKNVMIYEIKSSANANYSELLDNQQETFFWNQDKFKNLDIDDIVFVVNPHENEILSCRVKQFEIEVEVEDDTSIFSYENEVYTVSGKWNKFVALDILNIYKQDFSWKTLDSSENTYFYGDRVSIDSATKNILRLDSIINITKGSDLKTLERCKDFMNSIINQEMFPLIRQFIDQAANTNDLKYKKYIREYRGLQVRASFGKGQRTEIPWMSFLGKGQTTNKGIYPVLLYYLELDCLILSYGISEENQPDMNWLKLDDKANLRSYLEETYDHSPKRYGDSYLYNSYDLSQPIDNYYPQLEEDLNKIIDEYIPIVGTIDNSVSQKDENKNNTSMKINKNTILYGPPGTGKTYETSTLSLAIIEKKKREDYDSEKRKDITDRYKSMLGKNIFFTTFHQSFSYQDFVEGLRPKPTDKGDITYVVEKGIFREVCEKAKEKQDENFVLIIDEINRGNVSEILGELITLLEVDKRIGGEEETTVTLPYSRVNFGVPSNVYVIGTMNTADKSISLLDTALRRRFVFRELPPNTDLLEKELGTIEGVNISMLVDTINKRIEFLLDKDHKLGHSNFLSVKNLTDLKDVFTNKVVPQLEEYFHNDFESMKRVLGDNPEWNKSPELRLIVDSETDQSSLFGSELDGFEDHQLYEFSKDFINESNSKKLKEFFTKIYLK